MTWSSTATATSRKARIATALASLMVFLGVGSAYGHHSAAQFDFAHTTTIEGTVKTFDVANPHTHAVVVLADSSGKTREVDYEGHSASNFYRAGYSKGAVQPGEHIQLLIAPRRDGSDGGFIVWFKTQSGLEVGFRALPPQG